MIEREALTTKPAASPTAIPFRASASAPWAPKPGMSRKARGRTSRTRRSDVQVQRPAVDLLLLQKAGARVAGAREHEHALAFRAVCDQRLQRVVAEIRAGGERVGGEADGRCGETGRPAEGGAPVGRAGAGDVAALDVQDDGEFVLVGTTDHGAESLPAGGAVLLEERRLRLDAGGGVGDGVDDAAAELLETGGNGLVLAELGGQRPILLDQFP